MSIQVYSGFSGRRYTIDPGVTSTLEALRAWIARHALIQPRHQILLTSHGKQVRTQTLLTETELFVFDSSRLGRTANDPPPTELDASAACDFSPGPHPGPSPHQHDLASWYDVFGRRKAWAEAALDGCQAKARQAEQLGGEQAVIERSLGVAIASLQLHLRAAQQKHANIEVWASDMLREHDVAVTNWEDHLNSLRSVPARADFSQFLRPSVSTSSRRHSQQGNTTTLQGFVDVAQTKKAASIAKSLSEGFADHVSRIRDNLEQISQSSNELFAVADRMAEEAASDSSSEPAVLLDEIRVVVRKMGVDADTVRTLPQTSQGTTQASKMALLHTRNYLPSLVEFTSEMNALVRGAAENRSKAATSALDHMRALSEVESRLSDLFQQFKDLDLPQDDQQAFSTLSVIARLPAVYGQLLVESVRRREWVAKMKRDCGTLQEEVATYHQEEDKRRKKWVRTVDDVVDPDLLHSHVLSIELNLQNEGDAWPMVTRDELQDYLNTLNSVYGLGPMSEQLEQAIADLDKPTKKQVKHAKAFKNGSMYDAAFGDTSLFLRGDEQHRSLKEANSRLEDELKGQKSRVRKLEDLLHRQSQINRGSSVDLFTPQSTPLEGNVSPNQQTSQSSDDAAKPGSLRSRRMSLAQVNEEKKLARRVVDLEGQLEAMRQEATSRKSSDAEAQKQVEDAVATKRDLMDNMDAQQREFAGERRALEKDLGEARDKIEELESEIERILDARENEKASFDAKILMLEHEQGVLKDDATGHAARAATEHDSRVGLERKLKQAETARTRVEDDLQNITTERAKQQEIEKEALSVLTTALTQIAPGEEIPVGLPALAAALEEESRNASTKLANLTEMLALAESTKKSLVATSERQRAELTTEIAKQFDLEQALGDARDQLVAEKARNNNIQQQLRDEQDQLRLLRDKFAEGETGSEVLRQRVEEEEAKVIKLSTELAESKSHVTSLDIELLRLQKRSHADHSVLQTSSARFMRRGESAKEISQKLYAQNGRLARLLERLGFAINYPNNTMTVERASKMAGSTTMTESQPINRIVSSSSPSPSRQPSTSDVSANLAILHWPDAETAEEERAQFETFMQHISRFNIDVFSEAIVKRVRDFEYTARKYSKEAKEATKRAEGYKERSSKLHREAHAKLAVKDFKEGDLALFLPTRGQAKGAWAAFNIACPHFFLAEKEGMRLGSRDFIVARITRIEQRVVDLSRSTTATADGRSMDDISEAPSVDDDNPFDLSDGLTWWMVHANEERGIAGAPSTPGLGKSTVASANVDAKGSIRIKRNSKSDDASKHLNKSLDSRRSSSASKRSVAGALVSTLAPNMAGGTNASPASAVLSDTASADHRRSASQTSLRPTSGLAGGVGITNAPPPATSPLSQQEQPPPTQHTAEGTSKSQVRYDLLWGP